MQNLHLYLNDHLAGSIAALELVDHLIDTSNDPTLKAWLIDLRREIEVDQNVLQDLLRQVGAEESAMRKAGAWILEKFSRLKLQQGAEDNGIDLFQALEGLALGISGKRALWRMLAQVAATNTKLHGLDYGQLEERATEQFGNVESKCLELAKTVFQPE